MHAISQLYYFKVKYLHFTNLKNPIWTIKKYQSVKCGWLEMEKSKVHKSRRKSRNNVDEYYFPSKNSRNL